MFRTNNNFLIIHNDIILKTSISFSYLKPSWKNEIWIISENGYKMRRTPLRVAKPPHWRQRQPQHRQRSTEYAC